jgi:hypothetical protein
MHGKMHAECFLQHSVPNMPVVQCSSQVNAIYRSVHSRNIVFWAKENPDFYEELERNPPHVMVCDGHMFGPSFTGPLLDMLGE